MEEKKKKKVGEKNFCCLFENFSASSTMRGFRVGAAKLIIVREETVLRPGVRLTGTANSSSVCKFVFLINS